MYESCKWVCNLDRIDMRVLRNFVLRFYDAKLNIAKESMELAKPDEDKVRSYKSKLKEMKIRQSHYHFMLKNNILPKYNEFLVANNDIRKFNVVKFTASKLSKIHRNAPKTS